MKSRIILATSTAAVLATLAWCFAKRPEHPKESADATDLVMPATKISNSPIPVPSVLGASPAWNGFKKRFGESLQAEFHPDGRAAFVKGAPRTGARGSSSYRSSEADQVKLRAEEVFANARELIGATSKNRFADPLIQPGRVSAQVFFQQIVDGVPLTPVGTVSITLGPEGELIRLDNAAVPNIPVVNERRLTVDQAKTAASDVFSGAAVEGGAAVAWSPTGTEARHAYEFYAKGRQIIVDAQTGQVISNRDRRIH